jgi:hypothetical protein
VQRIERGRLARDARAPDRGPTCVASVVLALALAACGPRELHAREAPSPADERALLAARDRGDLQAMRAHGWALWAALQPAWPGYASLDAVFDQPERGFRGLRPFRNGDAIEAETLPVMFTVAFDPTAAAHIRRHHLAARTALTTLRAVPDFPRSAIALKLVWYPLHRDRPATLPIWDGTPVRPDALGNPDRTWPRTITIDPRTELDRFLHRTLAPADLPSARRVAHDPTLTAGDPVILLGMHVTTKEIPDWVWATYWWHDRPDDGPLGADRPAAVPGAARHYLMDVAYSAATPLADDHGPHACMNPWLEARFPSGLHSNCLTCHQRAAFGAGDYLPVTRALLSPADPYFAGKTTTDFLWSLALEAH